MPWLGYSLFTKALPPPKVRGKAKRRVENKRARKARRANRS